jgi:hypothetical protein
MSARAKRGPARLRGQAFKILIHLKADPRIQNMEWNSVPPEYAAKAIAVKALARKNRSLNNWYQLGGLLTAVAAGAGVLIFFPIIFDEARNWLVLVLVIAGVSLGLCMRAINPSAELSKCPYCAQDWTIREGKSVPLSKQMLTWDRCPGCGAIMNDGLLQIAAKKHTLDNLALK